MRRGQGVTVSLAGVGSVTVCRTVAGGGWWCQAGWNGATARHDVTVVHYDGHGPLVDTVEGMVVGAPVAVRAMLPALWAELGVVA